MKLTSYENVEIYKDDVIEALAFEPNLGFGYFFAGDLQDASTVASNCAVCAVGSILKPKFVGQFKSNAINAAATLTGPECVAGFTADFGKWMSALSIFWESLGKSETPVEEARRLTIDFVEEHFPDDEVLAEFIVEKQIEVGLAT